MSLPHWEDDYEIWDTLLLGKWVMPGIWTVDFSVRRELDVKKAISTDGARIKDKGYQPPQLTLVGKLTSREDWQELQRIMRDVHPRRPGAVREPFRISHPKTLLMGIEAIFIHEVDSVKLDNGVLNVELRGYEWTKPKPAKKVSPKPQAANADRTGPEMDTFYPDAYDRYPGMRGVLVDGDPDNPVVFLSPEL